MTALQNLLMPSHLMRCDAIWQITCNFNHGLTLQPQHTPCLAYWHVN